MHLIVLGLYVDGKISLSKRIKNSVKSAIKFISDFETTSAEIGIMNRYQFVICGHIHKPEIKTMVTTQGSIVYMNSGDWVENLTSLEFSAGSWSIYQYSPANFPVSAIAEEETAEVEMSNSQLFESLVAEFNLMKS